MQLEEVALRFGQRVGSNCVVRCLSQGLTRRDPFSPRCSEADEVIAQGVKAVGILDFGEKGLLLEGQLYVPWFLAFRSRTGLAQTRLGRELAMHALPRSFTLEQAFPASQLRP